MFRLANEESVVSIGDPANKYLVKAISIVCKQDNKEATKRRKKMARFDSCWRLTIKKTKWEILGAAYVLHVNGFSRGNRKPSSSSEADDGITSDLNPNRPGRLFLN